MWLSTVFKTWRDLPESGYCEEVVPGERTHIWEGLFPKTLCAIMVDCNRMWRQKMTEARSVVCQGWPSEHFPSDMLDYDRSRWRGQGRTWFCSWPVANATGRDSVWHGRSDLSWTPVRRLHFECAVVALVWLLAVQPTQCYNSPAWTLWTPGPAAVWTDLAQMTSVVKACSGNFSDVLFHHGMTSMPRHHIHLGVGNIVTFNK